MVVLKPQTSAFFMDNNLPMAIRRSNALCAYAGGFGS
jgi:hypothetical protein